MTLERLIAICAALAVLALPAASFADHHKAGGEAAEHRSDKAAEKSNAQWDEDNDGRPEKDSGDDADADADVDGADADDDGEEKKAKKEKKGKKDKKSKSDD
jgi:hypothetical protein